MFLFTRDFSLTLLIQHGLCQALTYQILQPELVCLWLVGSVEVNLDLERLSPTHYQLGAVVLVSVVLLLVDLMGLLEHMNIHNMQVICRDT